ncbi:MAG: glycyl-radical enzyme activating protein [Proteobacteria bacterium]|nr:glycyl-radical enzyme activating protein [Pseudomonadota bacterium]
MKHPLIIDIKGHSLDDGPGIRSVVFIKGCPLRCSWCQNPESQRPTAELSWEREKCIKCGSCVEICPEQAISGNRFFMDRKACSLCFACVEICPANALKKVGKAMTVDEIVPKVLRYRSFFDTSGGGVTLSGGEPTMFMEFAAALLRRFKEEGLHTLLETCGHFDRDHFERLIFPWIDTIYMDIKIVDPKKHQDHCGISNDVILENFAWLCGQAAAGNVTFLPRTPLIPGITDSDAQIAELVGLYTRHGVQKASLLGNNPIWIDKCDQLGIPDKPGPSSKLRDFYSSKHYEAIRSLFKREGITIVSS